MKKFLTFLMMLVLTTSLALAKKDLQVLVVTTTPQMHCSNCETKIKKNLRYVKGIKDIVTNVEKQTVTITYDAAKVTPEKIIKQFESFGYTAKEVKKQDGTCKGACCKKQTEGKSGGCCGKKESKANKEGGCCKKAEAKPATDGGCCGK